MHILLALIPFLFIVLVIVLVRLFPVYSLKNTIGALGGKLNFKGDGVFTQEGREFGVRYIPGSRNRSPELRIFTPGNFGADLLIRYETSLDGFCKRLGLNREPQIADREANDKLYFECDDQDFVNLLFLNPQTKADVLGLLQRYTDVEISRGMCLLKRYPAPAIASISKEDILSAARELADLAALIPANGGDGTAAFMFKIRRAILYCLGGIALGTGIISWLWAQHMYRVVDAAQFWTATSNISGPIALGGAVLAYFFIRGFSTSSKVFIFFLATFSAGAILCGRYGAAMVNGMRDRSPLKAHDQLVVDKYITTHKSSTYYHIVVAPWRPGRQAWSFQVGAWEYQRTQPGMTRYRIRTGAGSLGYEWVVSEIRQSY